MMGQLEPAQEQLARARELATRLGDRNLEAMAMVFQGTTLVMTGEVSEGLALLDEATARAVSGELDPLATGMVYCVTIHSCQTLGDCGRAAEWTTQANRWCDRLDVSGFPGACRIHRAEIMRLQGNWDSAEEQAAQACEELGAYFNLITSAGFNEIGKSGGGAATSPRRRRPTRRRTSSATPPAPSPASRSCASHKERWTRRPPRSGARSRAKGWTHLLARASFRPGRDRARGRRAGQGARGGNRARGDRRPVSDRRRTHPPHGRDTAAHPRPDPNRGARLRRCHGRGHGGAVDVEKVGAPYEAALARMLLGIVYRGEEDEHSARDEIQAAKATFERLGATLDTQRAAELLGEGATGKTFVFTDIVDSTKLLEAFGEEKWQKLLKWHDKLLRERIEEAGGEVIKQTGDGYFAAFGSPGQQWTPRLRSSARSTRSRSRPTCGSASTAARPSTRRTTTTPARASTWRLESARSQAAARTS